MLGRMLVVAVLVAMVVLPMSNPVLAHTRAIEPKIIDMFSARG